MKIKVIRVFVFLLLMLGYAVGFSAGNPYTAKPYTASVQNPSRDVGYIVGDTIKRTVNIQVQAPYQLARGSIPAKGVTHKGIELQDVQVIEKKSADSTSYQLVFTYQVFTSSPYAKKIALPKVPLQLANAGKKINLSIPAWRFRISPLATHNETYVEDDMSPYRGPMLIDAGHLKPLLGGFLIITLLSILGLIYINADAGWFPGMGGPFAIGYRRISNLSHNQENARHAVNSIHGAFNQTYGENLFPADIDDFLQKHPSFAGIRKEITEFFGLSNVLLYGVGAGDVENTASSPDLIGAKPVHLDSLHFLTNFCEQCRNCERGVG